VLKWRGATKRESNPLWAWQLARKFDDANHNHDRMSEALKHADILEASELRLSGSAPFGVGMRCDAIITPGHTRHVIDYKIPDPRMKPENTPKTGDIEQVVGYQHVLVRKLGYTLDDPMLAYIFGAGGGTIMAYIFPWLDFEEQTLEKMAALERLWLRHLAERDWLPDPLPREIVREGVTKVNLQPDWRCKKMYCDYAWCESCPEPENETKTLMQRKRKSKNNPDPQMEPVATNPVELRLAAECMADDARRAIRRASWYVESGFEGWREEDDDEGGEDDDA
jgi:hypothetical protein